jgi:hypothetical protein
MIELTLAKIKLNEYEITTYPNLHDQQGCIEINSMELSPIQLY